MTVTGTYGRTVVTAARTRVPTAPTFTVTDTFRKRWIKSGDGDERESASREPRGTAGTGISTVQPTHRAVTYLSVWLDLSVNVAPGPSGYGEAVGAVRGCSTADTTLSRAHQVIIERSKIFSCIMAYICGDD